VGKSKEEKKRRFGGSNEGVEMNEEADPWRQEKDGIGFRRRTAKYKRQKAPEIIIYGLPRAVRPLS
jgi:hypothetical protein